MDEVGLHIEPHEHPSFTSASTASVFLLGQPAQLHEVQEQVSELAMGEQEVPQEQPPCSAFFSAFLDSQQDIVVVLSE